MKKSFVWMFAAVLTCGLTISSCAKMDNGGGTPDVPEVDPETEVKVLDLDADGLDITEVFPVADPAKMVVSIEEDEAMGKVIQFKRSSSSGRGFAYFNFSEQTENATAVKMSFDFMIPEAILAPSAITVGDATVHNTATGVNEGQYGYTSNGAIFNIGATRGKINGSNTNYFWINDQPAAVDNDDYAIKASDVWGKWLHVDLNINVAEKAYTYEVKCGEEVWFASDTAVFISPNAETCTQIDVASGNTGTYFIDNLTIQKVSYDKSIKYADYTISFVDTEGNPIPEDLKTTITRRAKVGTAITLLDSDKANFANADGSVKYIYESDNSEGATVTEAGTQILVVFKVEEAKKYHYVVNCVNPDNKRLKMYSGEEFEGVKTYIYPSLCFLYEGAYYSIPPSNKYNGYEVTITGSEPTVKDYIITTLNYTKDESLVYWGEAEEIAKTNVSGEVTSWVSFNGNPFGRFSGGAGIKMAEGGYIWTDALEGGAYNIELYGRQDGKGGVAPIIGYRNEAGEVTWIEIEKAEWGSAWMVREVYENIQIPAGCSVVVGWTGTGITNSIDCVKITKYVAPEPAAE